MRPKWSVILCVDTTKVTGPLRYDYAITNYWLYTFWSAFYMDHELSQRMDQLKRYWLREAISYTQRGTMLWCYLQGERAYFDGRDPHQSIALYEHCLRQAPFPSRLYSQCAFAIARSYHALHDHGEYAHYLILSACSDLRGCAREYAALQELATCLYDDDPDNASQAHHYLMLAMDDAAAYNNKLRKLEISNRLPPIVEGYQKQLTAQTHRIWLIATLAFLLAVVAFVLFYLSRRRNAQLHLSQRLLEHKNRQLHDVNEQMHAVNEQMRTVNGQLQHLNGLLVEANRKREEYLRLFVDICASTMERITNYKNLVKLKVRANQTKDLLKVLNSDRMADHDMSRFFMQFDKAFLGLYPTFVEEFNKLLKPDYQVCLNKDGSMSTELRLFALIRLGVTESSEIATLLGYSPHTIYNYRSAMKGRSLDKEHFEEQVRNLCRVFPT